jgi:hypothetical protein
MADLAEGGVHLAWRRGDLDDLPDLEPVGLSIHDFGSDAGRQCNDRRRHQQSAHAVSPIPEGISNARLAVRASAGG